MPKKLKKIQLSKNRVDWVGKRTTNLKGKPLNSSAAIELAYYKKMMSLLDMMSKDLSRETAKLLRGNAIKDFAQDASLTSAVRIMMSKLSRKYGGIFSESAKGYAEYLVRQNLNHSKTTLGASLKTLSGGLTIETDLVTVTLKEVVKASVLENTNLIKTIRTGFLDGVEGDILRSITSHESGGIKSLQARIHESLTKRYKQHKNKAKNIALDQTRKVYNNINEKRMKAVGVKRFTWHHAGGSKEPRRDHIAMDGKVYSFDDLPVIDKRTGEKGIPGQAINCKCFLSPVISFEVGEEV